MALASGSGWQWGSRARHPHHQRRKRKKSAGVRCGVPARRARPQRAPDLNTKSSNARCRERRGVGPTQRADRREHRPDSAAAGHSPDAKRPVPPNLIHSVYAKYGLGLPNKETIHDLLQVLRQWSAPVIHCLSFTSADGQEQKTSFVAESAKTIFDYWKGFWLRP